MQNFCDFFHSIFFPRINFCTFIYFCCLSHSSTSFTFVLSTLFLFLFSTLSIFLRFAPVSWQIWNYSYVTNHSFRRHSNASLEEPAYQIYILVIHLSFEPDFDWNKVNTLSIRERTCLHSMFKPCILSVI